MLLAKRASNEDSKQTFLHLAQSWTRLAEELEQAETLISALRTMPELETE
ncbi:MAG TPA: hypothetical protein VFK91_04610 [Methyloceanibacter sp.]|nr:hypothetical protein [Methyloceanibacter sp.]